MIEMKDVTIIIPTRTDVAHIESIIRSIRSKEQYDDCTILVGADNPSNEVHEWLVANSKKHNFSICIHQPKEGESRVGLCSIVEWLVKDAKTDYVYYLHDDMVIGNQTIQSLMDRWQPKTVLSSLRIEPPIYPQSVEKILMPLGLEPQGFNNEAFLKAEQEIISQINGKEVEGFFAPHFFKKTDWIGYDPIFFPQSREDCITKERLLFIEKNGIKQLIRIEDLWNEYKNYSYVRNDRKEVLVLYDNGIKIKTTTALPNGCIGMNYIRTILRNKNTKQLYKIIAPWGETIVTEDHSLLDTNLNKIKPNQITNNLWEPAIFNDWKRRNKTNKVLILQKEFKNIDEYGNNKELMDLCEYLGFFVAEGSTHKNVFNICGNDKNLLINMNDKICRLFDIKTNKIITSIKENNKDVFSFSKTHTKFTSWLRENCGINSETKKIPTLIFNLPSVYQERFIYGYLLGDGYLGVKIRSDVGIDEQIMVPKKCIFVNNWWKIFEWKSTSKSDILTAGINYLLKRCYGLKTRIWFDKNKGVKGVYNINTIKSEYRDKTVTVERQPEYIDYVYDLEVERTHTFTDALGFVGLHNSDLAVRFLEQGYRLITVWNSIVYHFSGKGSRRKNGTENNEEWMKTNFKNQKNYVRKWGTLAHTEYILPVKAPTIPISAHILVGNDSERLYDFINHLEEYFDELVFVIDTNQSETIQHDNIAVIEKYIVDQEGQPNNFKKEKIKIFLHKLNGDFGTQTNFAISKCSNEWVIKLDVDEVFPTLFLNKLRFVIDEQTRNNPNLTVIGFPRINTLDGKVSNDIPREHWFTEEFNKYPEKVSQLQNPDIQFRLTRSEQWIGKIHEVPESVVNQDMERITVVGDMTFLHPKTREKQRRQQDFYKELTVQKKETKTINKYLYDSVIYTIEGITEHARQEVKELKKRGNNVFLLDNNYKEEFGDYLKDCYDPIDVKHDEYITIINQPPPRWSRSYGYKNLIGYLAFEGELNNEWVKIINESPIKELWTPSNYCKKMFIKSGVTKPVWVIPHGIDPELWKPKKVMDQQFLNLKKDGYFIFLASGTYNNNRKGLDLLAKAFSEEFGPEEKVKLLFKVNKIYNPHENFSRYIRPHINPRGNTNIECIDTDLSSDQLVDLYNSVDVFVSPHRSEGFGINILNALAVGLPVITTGATGNMDFCNKDNCLLISVGSHPVWSDFIPPYENSKWEKPDINSLKKNLRKAYNNYAFFKKRAVKASKHVHKEWTWEKTVDKMEERVKTLFC